MLSLYDPYSNEANDTSTQLRHGNSLKAKIETAAATLGVSKSVYLRWAIERQCSKVIEEQQRHKLTAADAEAFSAALEAPVIVSDRAARTAKAFATRVAYAD